MAVSKHSRNAAARYIRSDQCLEPQLAWIRRNGFERTNKRSFTQRIGLFLTST